MARAKSSLCVPAVVACSPDGGAKARFVFFEMKRLGRLRGGIGSALDERFLIRVEGPTPAQDDVVLEAKELRDLSSVPCVQASPSVGGSAPSSATLASAATTTHSSRSFLGDPRRPPTIRHLGSSPGSPTTASSTPRTTSSRPTSSTSSLTKVGLQLGRGHVRQIATPFDDQLRRAVRDMLRDYGPRIRATIDSMTERTLASWQHFRDEAAHHAP